jgi:hypothetical protein
MCSLKEVTHMPFWLTWFFIGALFTGGAAALHNATPPGTTAGPSTPQNYTVDFRDGTQPQ